jgi:hypothetical protein
MAAVMEPERRCYQFRPGGFEPDRMGLTYEKIAVYI